MFEYFKSKYQIYKLDSEIRDAEIRLKILADVIEFLPAISPHILNLSNQKTFLKNTIHNLNCEKLQLMNRICFKRHRIIRAYTTYAD